MKQISKRKVKELKISLSMGKRVVNKYLKYKVKKKTKVLGTHVLNEQSIFIFERLKSNKVHRNRLQDTKTQVKSVSVLDMDLVSDSTLVLINTSSFSTTERKN